MLRDYLGTLQPWQNATTHDLVGLWCFTCLQSHPSNGVIRELKRAVRLHPALSSELTSDLLGQTCDGILANGL
jgi:hypothetical protein